MNTPWREKLYTEIGGLNINGKIVDLGGSRKSEYHNLIKGKHSIEVVNIDDKYGYDIKFDLESSFPVNDGVYDAVLAINVLEHIYNYKSFLSESYRILKKGGQCVIGVPFLIQIHPCPHDYWRYSKETLERIIKEAGFANVEIRSIGKGPFTSSTQLLNNSLKFSLLRFLAFGIASALDSLINLFVKNYSNEEYPLGYFVIAKK